MLIEIKADEEKVLEAVKRGMVREGYPEDDIEDLTPDMIDEQDIERFVIPNLEVESVDIES